MVAFSSADGTTADIGGLVYYNHDITEGSPVEGADVTLYKRTAQGGWTAFGSSTATDGDGYYDFDDVEIGSGINDLCTNSDWFRVEFDATEAETELPEGYDEVLYRYAKNEAQPSGLPDTGWIRIDLNFVPTFSVLNPPNRAYTEWGVMGHFCYFDGEGCAFPTNEGVYATCPVGENPATGGGCVTGHWNNLDQSEEWSDEYGYPLSGQPDYARYEITDRQMGEEVKLGEGYYYWDLDWPSWALHQRPPSFYSNAFINIDFVDLTFPPE
ncbi:MAG: hypothetical protein GY771_01355 [bacterium]|nr:hypothetical protein [bacterium]